MSQGSDPDPLIEVHAGVQALAEQTRFHQLHVQTFAAAAERDVLSARKALACALGTPEPPIHVVRQLFRAQLQEREDSAETARRLVLDVRDHQVAPTPRIRRSTRQR